MGFNLLNRKSFTTVFITTMIFAMIASMILSPLAYAAGGGGPAGGDPSAEAPEESEFDPVLSETKPEVAPVPVNNLPNRIITTINGDSSSEMGFSWYTSDLFEDSKVWLSKSGEFDDT